MSRVSLGSASELALQSIRCIEHNDQQFVLIHHQQSFFLLDNLCPHKAAALCDGDIKGDSIQCPWHKARFDIRSGRGLSPLAGKGVNSYPLSIEGDLLMVDFP